MLLVKKRRLLFFEDNLGYPLIDDTPNVVEKIKEFV